jgi:hypothetical protein
MALYQAFTTTHHNTTNKKQSNMSEQQKQNEPACSIEVLFMDASAEVISLYAGLASTEKKLRNDSVALEAELKQQSEEAKRLLEISVGVL